jgi:hypothetical protein
VPVGHDAAIAEYAVNDRAVARARSRIRARQYVLDSDWGERQPGAPEENAYLESHSWEEYAEWHLALTGGATDETKARYAFVYGDFRRVHRSGLIACVYRAAEWRHKQVELAAHDLLQLLDATAAP